MPGTPALTPAASAAPADTTQTGHALTIVARENAWQRALQAIYVGPFSAATSIPADLATWAGGIDPLRANAAGWDLVLLSTEELAAACDAGLIEKPDWSAIGGRDHYMPMGVSDCGIGAYASAMVLAWDRDKFQGTPTWADFFDIAKAPGKRGLRRNVRGVLEIALLADGVAPGDVYRTLRSNDGVDRAFRKLDQLRPYIVWWQTDDEAAKLLGSHEVLMTGAPSGRISSANREEHRNFGIQWTGALQAVQWWALVKGSPNLKASTQFLYMVGTPAAEARMFVVSGDAGIARGANDFVPADALAQSPTSPSNLAAGLAVDESFWRDNQDKLAARFATWLGH